MPPRQEHRASASDSITTICTGFGSRDHEHALDLAHEQQRCSPRSVNKNAKPMMMDRWPSGYRAAIAAMKPSAIMNAPSGFRT
jgi:hypothetical protein